MGAGTSMTKGGRALGLRRAGRAVACGIFGLLAVAGSTPRGEAGIAFVLISPKFRDRGEIPTEYTCEGKDASPPLDWSGAPPQTKSFALIVDDPDAPDPKAPKRTFVHWVLYGLPASTKGLPEGVTAATLPEGARQGINDAQRPGYHGPCPPVGRHRYFFKLYALDTVLPDLGAPKKADLEKAMQGHVLANVELVGTYEKRRPH